MPPFKERLQRVQNKVDIKNYSKSQDSCKICIASFLRDIAKNSKQSGIQKIFQVPVKLQGLHCPFFKRHYKEFETKWISNMIPSPRKLQGLHCLFFKRPFKEFESKLKSKIIPSPWTAARLALPPF